MRHGSLFSGIGGFDLAAEWMGWENVFHCEINPFCQKVLKYYWPNAVSYEDITKTDFTQYEGKIDILSGGFPCQPYSIAGKRRGKEDDRHLWPAMLSAIKAIRPRWVVGENVHGIINWSGGLVFHEIQADLEAAGYEVWPYVLPACGVDAPHRRDRTWFIAYSNNQRCQREYLQICDEIRPLEKSIKALAFNKASQGFKDVLPEPKTIGRNDGISVKLDGIAFSDWRDKSTKAFGNAVVPQLVLQIFKAIEQVN